MSLSLLSLMTISGCSNEPEAPAKGKAQNDHAGFINEKQYVNGVEYTLDSVRRQSHVDSSELGTVKPAAGLEYLVCKVTATAKEDTTVYQGNLGLLDLPKETVIKQDSVSASFGPINPEITGVTSFTETALKAGQSCTIYGAFEIPKNYPLKNLKVIVGDDFSNPEDYSLIFLEKN